MTNERPKMPSDMINDPQLISVTIEGINETKTHWKFTKSDDGFIGCPHVNGTVSAARVAGHADAAWTDPYMKVTFTFTNGVTMIW